jgi:hypothetical protein
LLRDLLAGLAAFVGLTALLFALLSWRMNTPEAHLNFGLTGISQSKTGLSRQSHE